jgi:hypothetical protein
MPDESDPNFLEFLDPTNYGREERPTTIRRVNQQQEVTQGPVTQVTQGPVTTSSPLKDHRYVELAAFIELLYLRNGVVPTAQDLREQIPECDVSDETYKRFVKDPKIKAYLIKERALPLDAHARLTQKQLDWIKVVTDPSDMRPVNKKLSELKISRAEVTSWQANKFYQQVMYEQTNRTFGSSRYAVLRSLQVEAVAGNISAMKMYLEMTGDYRATSEVNVHVETRTVLNGMVDVLQRYLDPETLLKIVEELEAVAIPGLPGASPLAALPEPPKATIRELPKVKTRPVSTQVIDIDSDGW